MFLFQENTKGDSEQCQQRIFKFVSPGVFIKEIDNSQAPKTAPAVGPVVIGRFRRGPAFLPTRVESLSELIQVFGEPIRGDEGPLMCGVVDFQQHQLMVHMLLHGLRTVLRSPSLEFWETKTLRRL